MMSCCVHHQPGRHRILQRKGGWEAGWSVLVYHGALWDSGLRGNFVLSTLGCHTHGRAQQGWALCLQIHLLWLNLSYLNTSTPYTIVEEGLLIHDMKIFQFILKNDDPCAPLGLRNIDLDNNYL